MHICTKDRPWKAEYGTPVQHTDVREVGKQMEGYPAGDTVMKECTNCGHRWTVELPQ